MSLLEIDGLTHSFGENVLYKNAGFTLNKGEHIGIVGQNGTGKSTLIKICTEQIIPDSGRIVWQPNTTIGYLDQYAEIDHTLTMKEFLKSAFTKLFEMEAQALQLYEKAADGDMKSLELAARYQEQLEAHDFYSIDTAIERVANGLGLLAIGLDRPIAEMSGGQRAKVILAKLLLEKPDVLLLDEPTNFLDKDHVSSLKDSFTKYTSKATTIGRAQGLMQKHFETLRPLLFYPKNTLPAASDHAGCCHGHGLDLHLLLRQFHLPSFPDSIGHKFALPASPAASSQRHRPAPETVFPPEPSPVFAASTAPHFQCHSRNPENTVLYNDTSFAHTQPPHVQLLE